MRLLLLLLPLMVCGQNLKKSHKISLKLDFEVTDTILFIKDTVYICRENTRIRKTKDSIYIYAKHQYYKSKL